MKLFLALLVGLLLVSSFPATSQAQEYPWYSTARLSLAGGIEQAWYSSEDAPILTQIASEPRVGLFAGWNLFPNVDLVAGSRYGLQTQRPDIYLGVRWLFKAGKTSLEAQ